MAATTTTTATISYISCENHFTKSPRPNHFDHFSVSCSRLFPFQRYHYSNTNATKRKIQTIKIYAASSDASTSETTITAEAESPDEEAAIELPEGPPSLISALNVERALRGLAITDVDHYGVLNLPRGCSYDQVPFLLPRVDVVEGSCVNLREAPVLIATSVSVAYNKKIEELKSISQEIEDEELTKRYDQLKESYSILSTVEERRLYDWSLARVGKPDTYVWPNQVDITQIPCDPADPPAQEPEDIGPTRVTGYIIAGWLMVSFVLLVVLNR